MKLLLAAMAILGLVAEAVAEPPTPEPAYDRQLIIDAGRAYVEARIRVVEPTTTCNWEKPTIKAQSKREGNNYGYVAVFFPNTRTTGVCFAYFAQRAETQLHWVINRFGTDLNLQTAIANFERSARDGYLKSGFAE
ncbi:MAG: hypothetical protein ACT4PK_08750 [Gammaproteobacteria bacterium]